MRDTFIVQVDSAAVSSSIFQNCSPSSMMCRRERTHSNSIMFEDVDFSLSVRLVNVAIYILHLVAHTTHHPPRTRLLLLVDARTLRTIRLAILMLTIDRGKVIQLRDSITMNCLPAFPSIRGTHSAVFILHPSCVSATHHI